MSMQTIQPRSPTLEYKVKTWLTPIRKWIVLFNTERQSAITLPIARKVKAWRLGFTSQSYALYNLDQNNPDYYLRDFSDINYILNNPGAYSVNNKFIFPQMLGLANIPTPGILALINQGAIVYPIQHEDPDRDNLAARLKTVLGKHKKIVLRPTSSGGGYGVFFLDYSDDIVTVNRKPAELSAVCRFLKKHRSYLITEFVDQAQYSKEIYPDSTNTVRIMTIWDSTEKQPVIIKAAHRFGSGRSFPIDNFHAGSGGLSSPIDLDSGELGPGLTLSKNGAIMHYDRHPETGGRITGIKIPNWDRAKEMVLEGAALYAVSPYIGWDIIMTDNGCSFIEGNSPPGPLVCQVHGSLLQDVRLKRFYMEQGML